MFLHESHFAAAFRQMTVHLDIQLLRQINGRTDNLLCFIVGNAGADADLTHREAGRIMIFLHQPFDIAHDAFNTVYHLGRDDITGDGVVAAHWVEADSQFLCGFDFGIYQTGHADRVRIPQIVGGGDAGFQPLTQRHIYAGTSHIGIQILIDLVHGGEPRLQPQTLRGLDVADQSLPGMMMGVDKAGQDHSSAGIYHLVDGDGIPKGLSNVFADGLDLFAANEQIRMTIATALLVHGNDPIRILIQYCFHNVFSFCRIMQQLFRLFSRGGSS